MTDPMGEREHQAEEQAEVVRALLNATAQGIYGVDLEGNCTFANPVCLRLLGCGDEAELLGKNMHQLIHHTRPSGAPYPVDECRIYQAFREGRGTHVGDEIVWRTDGTSFPAEYWSDPLFLHGELAGCVVAFVDITERKHTEEELRQAEKLSALGKLSAGLAHELNNPAAAAQRAAAQLHEQLAQLEEACLRLSQHGLEESTWARLRELRRAAAGQAPHTLDALGRADREDELATWLSDHDVADAWEVAPSLVAGGVDEAALDALAGALPADAIGPALTWISQSHTIDELVETVAVSAGSISELVGAVKEYSYMDRAPQQEVDVHVGLESTLRILDHKLKRGPRLVREFDRSLPPVFVPGGELNQVWTNLIDNAIDAAGPEGEVRIRTYAEDGSLVVEVADNGGGIPQEVQERIFDPFVTTKDVGSGTGLGLAVACRIVTDRCNGAIDFSSKPGETRFWVRLPAQPATGTDASGRSS